MSDDNKDANLQSWIEPDLEARVVAWVLGEASAFEAAELERILAEKPELGIFKRRMEAVHGLVAAASRMELDPLRMDEQRRKKLLERLGGKESAAVAAVVAMPEPKRRAWWSLSRDYVAVTAVCLLIVALLASIATPAFTGVQVRAVQTQKLAEERAAGLSKEDLQIAESSAVHLAPPLTYRSNNTSIKEDPAMRQRLAALDSLKALAQRTEDRDDDEDNAKAPALGGDAKKVFIFSGTTMASNVDKNRNTSDRVAKTRGLARASSDALPERDYDPNATSNFSQYADLRHSPRAVISGNAAALEQDAQRAQQQLSSAGSASGAAEARASLNGAITDTGATTLSGGAVAMDAPVAAAAAPRSSLEAAPPPAAPALPAAMAGTVAKAEPVQMEAAGAPAAAAPAGPAERLFAEENFRRPTHAAAQTDENAIGQTADASRALQPQMAEAGKAVAEAAQVPAAIFAQDKGRLAENSDSAAPVQSFGMAEGRGSAEKSSATHGSAGTAGQMILPPTGQAILDPVTKKNLGWVQYGAPIPAADPASVAPTSAAESPNSNEFKDDLDKSATAVAKSGAPAQLAFSAGAPAFTARFNLGSQTTAAATVPTNRPVLGDIPVIGNTFTFRSKQQIAMNPAADHLSTPGLVIHEGLTTIYSPIQNEISASDQPYSTFSLHVSDVSFLLAKAALASGQLPDPDSIRPEEFYNAFDYGDPAPATGEKIACRMEQAAHPMLQERNLVRIAMKVADTGRGAGQPLRLTVLLDTSGSMEREDRAASVQQAMKVLTSLLGPNDAVTLIGFARQPRLLAEEVPGDQAGKLVQIVKNTPPQGGTNMEEALKTASELALRHFAPGGQNRVVMLTDGAANLGDADPVQLSKLVERLRQQGVSFDACGVGADGLNDDILEALTRKGGGRYYFLNQPSDADEGFARQLAGAFRPAAENVKMQVRFNPDRVGKYRLIGFEKHRLKQEDFRNDKVTAAQLAAEEAAVALYQVQVLPEGEGEIGEVFVRFRDPSSGAMVEQSWTIPYDAQAPALDKASPSMQLAATASLVAEKLRGGPAAEAIDLDALAPIVGKLRGDYAQQARVRDLGTMFEEARRMTARK